MATSQADLAGNSVARTNALLLAIIFSLSGVIIYIAVGVGISPPIQTLYDGKDPSVIFAPSHFNDARQYVFICSQGYFVPYDPMPTLVPSRINWMPMYAWAQCAVHHLTGLSLVFTGLAVSAFAIGITVLAGALTLTNLGIRYPALHAMAALTPLVGGAWLFLPSVEATYLGVGMVVMWMITLPAFPDTQRGRRNELIMALLGIPLGVVFILTKPNALAFLLPLAFAFIYQSWKRSREMGYAGRLWEFAADVVIAHLRPFLPLMVRLRPGAITLEDRPIRYVWAPLTIGAGILLGFCIWLAYTSLLSGIPVFFLNQQLYTWGRAWPPGNVGDMILYFAQAFRRVGPPWRTNAAWNLGANVSALIPAASPRVPGLIRGMLPLMVLFILYSGAVHGSDRYILATALVALGWGCWIAPGQKRDKWWIARWAFVLGIAAITFYILVWGLFPTGNPASWSIEDINAFE